MTVVPTRTHSRLPTRGFTLIELMVVVAMLAILAALASPSWTSLIVNNKIRAAVNEWNGSLQFARSEALRQNTTVVICASNNGISCTANDYEAGWIVTTTGANPVLLQDTLPKPELNITPINNAGRILTILPNGQPVGNFFGTRVTVSALAAPDNSSRKTICIARSGRARVFTEDQYMALPNNTCTS